MCSTATPTTPTTPTAATTAPAATATPGTTTPTTLGTAGSTQNPLSANNFYQNAIAMQQQAAAAPGYSPGTPVSSGGFNLQKLLALFQGAGG